MTRRSSRLDRALTVRGDPAYLDIMVFDGVLYVIRGPRTLEPGEYRIKLDPDTRTATIHVEEVES